MAQELSSIDARGKPLHTAILPHVVSLEIVIQSLSWLYYYARTCETAARYIVTLTLTLVDVY